MKKISLFAVLCSIWLLAACSAVEKSQDEPATVPEGAVNVPGGSYTDITVQELDAMLESKDFTFVNVHIPFEGDIPQTDVSIPYNEIDQRLDQLPEDKDAKIVLYCRSDYMSTVAAKTLVKMGYTHVYNLDGGFAAWEAAGLPVER